VSPVEVYGTAMTSMHIHPIPCGLGIAFLIETPHALYLVDCGSPGHEQLVLAKMRELGRADLKLIWITHAHYDHYGCAAALRQATGAHIGIHTADAGFLAAGKSPIGTARGRGFGYIIAQPVVMLLRPLPPAPPDFTLEDGETLERYGLDAAVLHTPGHTPGHTCLLLENSTAFAADLVSSGAQPALQRMLATDWSALPTSLARLQSAHPDWFYTGHSRRRKPGELLQQVQPHIHRRK